MRRANERYAEVEAAPSGAEDDQRTTGAGAKGRRVASGPTTAETPTANMGRRINSRLCRWTRSSKRSVTTAEQA